MSTTKLWPLALLGVLAALGGCGDNGDDEATVARPPLTAAEARTLATTLANEAFAAGRYTDPAGRPVGRVAIDESLWQTAEQQEGRWVFKFAPAGQPQAIVSFDLTGQKRRVQVGFNLE